MGKIALTDDFALISKIKMKIIRRPIILHHAILNYRLVIIRLGV